VKNRKIILLTAFTTSATDNGSNYILPVRGIIHSVLWNVTCNMTGAAPSDYTIDALLFNMPWSNAPTPTGNAAHDQNFISGVRGIFQQKNDTDNRSLFVNQFHPVRFSFERLSTLSCRLSGSTDSSQYAYAFVEIEQT